MRPVVIVVNITALAWFVCIQIYRFQPSGRACSGDFLVDGGDPAKTKGTYMITEGKWFFYYIVAHYIVFVV